MKRKGPLLRVIWDAHVCFRVVPCVDVVEVDAVAAALGGEVDAALHEVDDARVRDVDVVFVCVVACDVSEAPGEVVIVWIVRVDGAGANVAEDDLVVGLCIVC